ncbi:hypothetical protein MNBD_GAMMA13-405 [hydrothermal vent metagenome]|uniref:Uncharacterized protein n=1 Tax=hydrothermal vent metagenome TaxID=652676 RepID=A0A3B0ZKQ9_9ZZZZ
MSKKHTEEVADDSQLEAEQSRRDFLKTAGKFAVYTPPAVMLLMKPSYATLSKSYNGRPGHGDKPKMGRHGKPKMGHRGKSKMGHRGKRKMGH